jgi:hypothetical protein
MASIGENPAVLTRYSNSFAWLKSQGMDRGDKEGRGDIEDAGRIEDHTQDEEDRLHQQDGDGVGHHEIAVRHLSA